MTTNWLATGFPGERQDHAARVHAVQVMDRMGLSRTEMYGCLESLGLLPEQAGCRDSARLPDDTAGKDGKSFCSTTTAGSTKDWYVPR